ncbi:Macrolide export ATP-binding/permease protein MacB [Limihaloglobus sulfuriphilus]|uniref:Macrolide export ATP-binding/permease protein MacB n=1 Tax=Limihaloglobus sulfuriphilus TaxID=1851148 RepID=A0A1Q2MFX5_9BACT|nr:ABC transporter ATP-binding protein [Limihaloglobus sulfuriphilus]AQQ71207.1 Macrolide export ATP-binding/permease protein MacB [Limihaloglobus sulfuriphilus]
MAEKKLIQLNNITKIYQMGREKVHALAGVTHEFEKGSFWAIMGASGSGKSTLMNILGCLDRITSGSYSLGGSDVSTMGDDELSRLRLNYIGFIFQSFNLIPQLTVRRNIELPLYYAGVDEKLSMEKAEELAARVGLGDRLNHRPTELSGGQMQRVAIARALANDPQMLLADEPTGNLDTATGEQIMELLTSLHGEGKTIIMVTHESDVAAHAEHRLHMKDGFIDNIESR